MKDRKKRPVTKATIRYKGPDFQVGKMLDSCVWESTKIMLRLELGLGEASSFAELLQKKISQRNCPSVHQMAVPYKEACRIQKIPRE